MNKKTVLLFGGSFNPVHEAGHIKGAKKVFNAINASGKKVDEVWLLPAAQNPDKPTKGMASFRHRFKMCQLQMQGQEDWLKVCCLEGVISPPHYTHAVLTEMLKAYPYCEFVWMMGSDNLAHFHQWEYWEDILQMMAVVVVGRDSSVDLFHESEVIKAYTHSVYEADAPLFDLPNIRFVDIGNLSANATAIRKAVAANKPTPGLHSDVRSYISMHNLYR